MADKLLLGERAQVNLTPAGQAMCPVMRDTRSLVARRLGEPELRWRSRAILFFGDGDEVALVADFHSTAFAEVSRPDGKVISCRRHGKEGFSSTSIRKIGLGPCLKSQRILLLTHRPHTGCEYR
jgi:hypothetical protein